MDLHQKEVQGFFNCPIDNLRASNFLIEFITQSVSLMNFFTNVISCCRLQYSVTCVTVNGLGTDDFLQLLSVLLSSLECFDTVGLVTGVESSL